MSIGLQNISKNEEENFKTLDPPPSPQIFPTCPNTNSLYFKSFRIEMINIELPDLKPVHP